MAQKGGSNRAVTHYPRFERAPWDQNRDPFKKFRVRRRAFACLRIDPESHPLSPKAAKSDQRSRLDTLAGELDSLQDLMHANGQPKLLLVLQGMDTSGKDGTVRWVFSRTSPLGVRVAAFKAPYGRGKGPRLSVALPCSRAALGRGHGVEPQPLRRRSGASRQQMDRQRSKPPDATNRSMISSRLLSENGTTVLKCMLHISRDEQRKRLQARVDDPTKHWKFSLGRSSKCANNGTSVPESL